MRIKKAYLLLHIPLVLAILAAFGYGFFFKAAVSEFSFLRTGKVEGFAYCHYQNLPDQSMHVVIDY